MGKHLPGALQDGCLLAFMALALNACGGGGGSGGDQAPHPAASLSPPAGAPSKTVAIGSNSPAVVALFPDGRAFYSPDGYNLAGGGSTTVAYNGADVITGIEAVGGGVEALFADGSLYFSPDGRNLGGGGSSTHAYSGPDHVILIAPVSGGIDVAFASGPVFFSPDGKNVNGTGSSVRIYNGAVPVKQLVPLGNGVLTWFSNGTAFLSPDNRNLGGGGSTTNVNSATHTTLSALVPVSGGVIAQFSNSSMYLSPDGQHLAGGGASVAVAEWDTSVPDGPFGGRDSANGAQFAGHWWLSGGFDDPTNTASCFSTCSYFDLWSSTDLRATFWNSKASFATATTPNPRDATPVVNNGVQDVAAPTDFYDSYSPLVAWNNQLFAIGSTVWSSPDGVSWTRQNLADGVTAAPGPIPPTASENSRATVLGSTLFFIQLNTGEVYSTTDPSAVSWHDLGAIPGFTPRCGAVMFTLQQQIWIEGGGACDYSQQFNDIWRSSDGITWIKNPVPAAWSARMWPCVATGADAVWLVGGYAPTDFDNTGGNVSVRFGGNHSDVWYSKDATIWKQFKSDYGSGLQDDGALEPRHASTCYLTSTTTAPDNLVVIGGSAGPAPNVANEHVSNTIRTLRLPATAMLP